MQLKAPKSRNMASLKDEEQAASNRQNNNNNNNSHNASNAHNNTHSNNNNNNNEEPSSSNELKAKRESLEARKQALEQRLCEKSWLLQQMQKQEAAIMQHGNFEHMTINEFFAQLAQQYKHEQQLLALQKESNSNSNSSSSNNNSGGGSGGASGILRRKQSTSSRESHSNNNRHSETHSNRSSEYDNYQPTSDMLVIGVAQQQAQQQQPHVKSALKKRPAQMQYMAQAAQRQQQQQQQQHLMLQQHVELYAPPVQQHLAARALPQPDVISLYSANSANVATLRQQHVAPQMQQPIIVQCDKYYLSPTHQSYNEGGFIKSSQNIKKYVSPLSSPSNVSYEQPNLPSSLQHQAHQRQLDAISLAPSYMSMETATAAVDLQPAQYRWRSQSHIAPPLTPPQHQQQQHALQGDAKSHSSDMLAAPLPRYPKPLDEISLSSLNSSGEKKPKPKQWLESSLDGPALVRQLEPSPSAGKPRAKLSSQSMSVSGRHYSMSAQRTAHPVGIAHAAGYAAASSVAATLQHADDRYAKLSQSTSYLNAMEQQAQGSVGISASYALEPLDIPPFRHLPPKPNQTQQPTPPPRPPPHIGAAAAAAAGGSSALVSPPLAAAAASLSPEIRIESPKNMTIVQQATFQPYKEVTKPFEMSDFYKYSTKFKQKEGRAE